MKVDLLDLNLPSDLADNVWRAAQFIAHHNNTDIIRIVLYGSWAKGTARKNSDVDIGLIVNFEAPWFRPCFKMLPKILQRQSASRFRRRYAWIEPAVNQYIGDGRTYSIRVLTIATARFHQLNGPPRLKQWVNAVLDGVVLWTQPERERKSIFSFRLGDVFEAFDR